ncbi:MAG TPA: HD domain-containing phosphohydrolase [Solirubrobacteraceae bacterium]|nr:HD domain-containing phosphohydrolase [Solirubrobacteraceae bacterium]
MDVAAQPTVPVALRTARETLGMEVAYTSQLIGEHFVVRELDGDGASFGLVAELELPRERTFCQRMLEGRIPSLIPDVWADDRTGSVPVARSWHVGAVASVPLTFSDERLWGTLCALSHNSRAFEYRDLQFLQVLARLISAQVELAQASADVKRLATQLELPDEATMTLTAEGVVTGWNEANERRFGYGASEAIGRDVVDLLGPPGREDELRQAVNAAAAGRAIERHERIRRASGNVAPDAMTLSPIYGADGEVSSISVVSHDIPEALYQAHYRMVERTVVNSMSRAPDVAEATMGMLRGMGEGLDCQIGLLWELDETEQLLHCSASWTTEYARATPFAQSVRDDRFNRGEGIPGLVWETGKAVWVEGVERVAEPRMQAAAGAGVRTAVGVPLRLAGEVIGVVEFLSGNLTPRDPEMLAMGEAIVARLADALARRRAEQALRAANQALEARVLERTSELERVVAELDAAQIETVRRLSTAVEFRDHDTGAHIARISAFAGRIARRAGLAAGLCQLIERASPLHDVGKVAIPDSVLLKPGALTAAERAVMETHAEIGHRLLDGSDSPVLQMAAVIALTHHERYDGTGYPRRLAGDAIPIEGRIVAIADVFDAITSDRVYRPAMTLEQAVAVLREGRGTHFDPVLLDHFLDALGDNPRE